MVEAVAVESVAAVEVAKGVDPKVVSVAADLTVPVVD